MRRRLKIATLLACLAASALSLGGCGTTLSAEQQVTYDKLVEDRDNEQAWIGMVSTERAQLRAKTSKLEKKKGAATGGALVCGAWGGGKLRMGKSPAGKGKGRAIELGGGGKKTVAGGACSSGSARLTP